MVLPVAFALMGKAASDKMRQDEIDARDREENRAWMQEERANTRAEREFQRSERARVLKNRDAAAAAAAPVVPQDGTVFQPENDDEGNPMPANPTAGTFVVDGQRFSDRAQADAAANAPAKRVARMSAALEQGGDLAGAQALRTGARQEQVADLQLSQAQLAAERDRGLREVGKLILSGGWGSVPTVYDKYRDGAKATVKEDGQGGATITYAGTDGKTIGSKSYKALPEFFADVMGGFDPAKWFDYQNSQEDKKRVQGNWEKDFGLRQDSEQRRAVHEARMLTAAERSARAAEGKANGTEVAATPESTFDRKTATDIAKEAVTKEADLAAKDGKPMSAQAMAKRVDEIVGAAFQQHANRFVASTVQRELQAAQADPAAYAAAYAKASRVLPPTEIQRMGFRDPNARPAPQAGTPAASIAAAPAGSVTLQGGKYVPAGQDAPTAAPAPAGPGTAPAAQVPFVEFLSKNITTPDGKAAISRRIAQDLPRLQATIDGDMKVMALPMVSGAIKARLKARIDAAAQEAEMMQTFLAGNPGI